jgi:hypothetical protein
VTFSGLQRTYANHLPSDLLALFIGDRDDDAILALLAPARMMNRALDAHGRRTHGLRLGIPGIEP